MARRLTDFNFNSQRGSKPKYPWDKWTNGDAWEVVHDKDFTCAPGSLVVYLYHQAGKRGLHVKTSIVRGEGKRPDRVVFQFYKAKSTGSPAAIKQRKPLKRK